MVSATPPASAAAPSISISPPGENQRMEVSSFAVVAAVSMPTASDRLTGNIQFNLSPLDPESQQPAINADTPANGARSQTVSFGVAIEYNGKYRATVSATGVDGGGLLGDSNPETATRTRDFFVVAPPAQPTNVRPTIDAGTRVVTLSWSPNSEKDLLFYVVQRDGAVLGKVENGQTSFVDRSTAEAGGDYRYQVVAVRRGATAEEGVNSDPSATATASVPGPPGPPTTASGTPSTGTGGTGGTGTGGSGTGGSGSTATTVPSNSPGALKKSGTIDLSGFGSIQSQARRAAPRLELPDTGFNETLPFGTTGTTRLVEEGEDEPAVTAQGEVRELGAEAASNDRQRSTAFLAAGLLVTVILMHLLWIKGEVQREPLEALTPE